MKNLKTYENFSGKIKYTKPEDLDTHEVIELINIFFELKPSLPDEFPKAELSKLIKNEVKYLSFVTLSKLLDAVPQKCYKLFNY